MASMSDFLENELIDHVFRARSYTAPAAMYVGLHTGTTTDAGGGTEVTGGSYARVNTNVTPGFANWQGTGGETTDVDSTGTGGATQNRNIITFATPSANWGTITHLALWTAVSSGSMYFHGALTTQKTVNNGDPAPTIAAGALVVTLA